MIVVVEVPCERSVYLLGLVGYIGMFLSSCDSILSLTKLLANKLLIFIMNKTFCIVELFARYISQTINTQQKVRFLVFTILASGS